MLQFCIANCTVLILMVVCALTRQSLERRFRVRGEFCWHQGWLGFSSWALNCQFILTLVPDGGQDFWYGH